MTTCRQCGAVLPAHATRGPKPEFCGTPHRRLWFEVNRRRGEALLVEVMESGRPVPERIQAMVARWRREDAARGRMSWWPETAR